MERQAKFFFGIVLFSVAVSSVGWYSYLKSREFLLGPQINIESPADGSTAQEALQVIRGTAQNVAYISLNGAPIFIDSKGVFQEKLLLLPGYNILTVSAQDRFGKKIEKTLELIYKDPPEEIVASSTPKAN